MPHRFIQSCDQAAVKGPSTCHVALLIFMLWNGFGPVSGVTANPTPAPADLGTLASSPFALFMATTSVNEHENIFALFGIPFVTGQPQALHAGSLVGQ